MKNVSLDIAHLTPETQQTYQSNLTNENNIDDAQAFAQMLGDENIQVGSMGDQVIRQFMHITNNLQQSKNQANLSIKEATLSPDPKNILKMMHKMNDYSEQVTIGSRLVTKVSSAVDQLTKLQ